MEIENQVNAAHPAANQSGENVLDNASAVEQSSAPEQSGASAVSSTDEQIQVHDGDLQQTDPASFAKRIGKIKAKAGEQIGALSTENQILRAQLQQYQAGLQGAGYQQSAQPGVVQPSTYEQNPAYSQTANQVSNPQVTDDPVAIFEQLSTQAQQRKAQQDAAKQQTQVFKQVASEIEGARDLDPEFDSLMENPPVTEAMVYALNGIDNKAAFLKYAIKNNRAELEQISRYPNTIDQVAVMSRMAARFATATPKVNIPKPPAPVEAARGANGQFASKPNELRGAALAQALMPTHPYFKRT